MANSAPAATAARTVACMAPEQRLQEYIAIVTDLVGHETDPCELDGRGFCVEHGWLADSECVIARARRALSADGALPA